MHVLVVDDEVRLATLIAEYLRGTGTSAEVAHDGPSALTRLRGGSIDAVILDWMLPGLSGVDVCRQLRAERNNVVVLMLTARGAVAERVEALEAGADGFVIKPFSMEELAARLKALVRRGGTSEAHRLVVADVVLDRAAQQLWVAGSEVGASPREFAMLAALMERAGKLVTRQTLINEVWETGVADNVVDVCISRVRAHLQHSARVTLTTRRGLGYVLDERRGEDA